MQRLILFLALFIFLSASLRAQEKYSILQNPLPGKYVQTIKTRILLIRQYDEQETGEGTLSVQEMEIHHEIGKKDKDGSYSMSSRTARFKIKRSSYDSVEMEFDSEDAGSYDEELQKVFGALLKTTLVYRFDKDGNLLSIEGLDDLKKEIESHGKYERFKEWADYYGTQFEGIAKDQYQSNHFLYPPGPVAVNESWKTDPLTQRTPQGEFDHKGDVTLTSVKKSDGKPVSAKIVLKTRGVQKEDYESIFPEGRLVNSDGAFDMTTTFQYDFELGTTTSQTIKMKRKNRSVYYPKNNEEIDEITVSNTETVTSRSTVERVEDENLSDNVENATPP